MLKIFRLITIIIISCCLTGDSAPPQGNKQRNRHLPQFDCCKGQADCCPPLSRSKPNSLAVRPMMCTAINNQPEAEGPLGYPREWGKPIAGYADLHRSPSPRSTFAAPTLRSRSAVRGQGALTCQNMPQQPAENLAGCRTVGITLNSRKSHGGRAGGNWAVTLHRRF